MKVCPFVDQISACAPHTTASREALSRRLEVLNSEDRQKAAMSPSSQVFIKTLSYFSALKRLGCGSPIYETTVFTEIELKEREETRKKRNLETRGHPGKETCNGRLYFEYASKGEPFIRCVTHNHYCLIQAYKFNISDVNITIHVITLTTL